MDVIDRCGGSLLPKPRLVQVAYGFLLMGREVLVDHRLRRVSWKESGFGAGMLVLDSCIGLLAKHSQEG